jgi:radical SAM protein with 4Fe4S-binding SPASM domain
MVSTTEAPQLRRIVLERRGDSRPPIASGRGVSAHHAAGVRDGNGIVFIAHNGNVCPSGFLELPVGNVRHDDVIDIYRNAPLFRELRDADTFGGRCGCCEHRWMCGGSRARAFAASGDPRAEDPLCSYVPRALSPPVQKFTPAR